MKVLIWDFNGTILDDIHLCHEIETKMLVERGMKTYTLEEYRDMFTFPVINYYYKMGYTFENETYDDISIEFHDMFDAKFSTLKVMDDFIETIERAISCGYENMILSATRHDKLLEQVKELGIQKYFTEIMGTDNLYGGSKIDIAKDMMARRNLNPDDCMYIGDSEHDAECAHEIGINHIVLVATGHQSRERLENSHEVVVDHLSEVMFDEKM